MPNRHGLVGRITAVSEEREELARLLAGMDEMPGCLSYRVALDRDDPDVIWVTEVWESEQAHADSLQLPHVIDAIARGRPLIAAIERMATTIPVH